MTFTAAEVARVVGGTLLQGPPEAEAKGLSIDSRNLRPGQAFAAIPGARTDGHNFAAAAAAAGAPLLLVERDVEVGAETAVVRAPDATRALADLGRHLRMRAPMQVVGVTGSIGKTTTRTLCAAALEAASSTGNLNTVYGLALVLAGLPDSTARVVLEMGISRPGEMAVLSGMAAVDAMLLTNVAPVHTEFFSSMEELAREKASSLQGLRPGGGAAWNGDDPLLDRAASDALPQGAACLRFGEGEGADLRLLEWSGRGLEGGVMRAALPGGGEVEVELNLPGRHNARNALAAMAGGILLGVSPGEMAARLAGVTAVEGRGRVMDLGPVLVIDESYNASPRAMEAALALLAESECGRRVAVLGDMLELGEEAVRHHREAGREAAGAGVDLLLGVGPLMASAVESARAAGVEDARSFEDAEEAGAWLAEHWREGDLVLVKGSRGMGTERVIEALRAATAGGGA